MSSLVLLGLCLSLDPVIQAACHNTVLQLLKRSLSVGNIEICKFEYHRHKIVVKGPYPGKWHVSILALLYLVGCLNE